MCGIVGTIDWSGEHPPDVGQLGQMLGMIRHRGPDEAGVYVDACAGLGNVRLSVIDLSTGQQPITNEDGTLWIVCNGEVYNYPELRAELETRGHRFTTQSDTEVVLHLYEELGPACLERLNGQFALAIWNVLRRTLFLARDRVGICPLYYVEFPQGLVFGSEMKALFVGPRIQPHLDPYALAQVFSLWAPLAPRSTFAGVRELSPGCYAIADETGCRVSRYWRLPFPEAGEELRISKAEAAERLHELLSDAVRLCLRADVPVGSYLSGGLDSTFIAALIREHSPDMLSTFSVAFEDPSFDERVYQELAVAALGTTHHRAECRTDDIGVIFPEIVWHAEVPLIRTAPAPMAMLSRLVHNLGIKVVMTGEGADEFIGGYNIYKEDKVRRFWARDPESAWRRLPLRRLYPYVGGLGREGDAYLAAFFGQGLTETGSPGYSHRVRWRNTARLQRFFSEDLQSDLAGYDATQELLASLDGVLEGLSPLAQAQTIEATTFMSEYLLTSQGDRMMAANSVEGRFPFLDHRVIEFCNALPPHYKLHGLQEKHILKRSAESLVPNAILRRHKQPYRAPIHCAFFGQPLDYVDALLAPEAVTAAGIWNPQAVDRLRRKATAGGAVSELDDMALVGMLSTQLLYATFVESFPRTQPDVGPLRICRGKNHVVLRRGVE